VVTNLHDKNAQEAAEILVSRAEFPTVSGKQKGLRGNPPNALMLLLIVVPTIRIERIT
jgi:hypothetical protein